MANRDGDFDALARQYWAGWNQMMRQAANAQGVPSSPFGGIGQGFAVPGFGAPSFAQPFAQSAWPGGATPGLGAAGMGGWQDALSQWSRFAQTMGAQTQPDLTTTLNDTLSRFQQQAGDWYGRMQQLAGEFAGQVASAGDVAERWKQLLEHNGDSAWLDLFRGMQSPQMHGFDAWYEVVQPILAGWRNEARGWLGMPAFGVAREHQERLQKLIQAQLDYQDALAAHNAMLSKSAQEAYGNFEKKLAEHEAPGLEITSARALFDVWIDAAEDAFAAMALSAEYRETYGAMVNAQMRLRHDVQKEIEHATGQLGMPTRTEIEAAHRKIAELERIVRRMMRGEAAVKPASVSPSASAASRPARKPAVRKPSPKPASSALKRSSTHTAKKATTKKAARESLAKKSASRTTAARKPAAKKSVAKKTARKTVKRSR